MLLLVRVELSFLINNRVAAKCGNFDTYFFFFFFVCHLRIFSHTAKARYADLKGRGKEIDLPQVVECLISKAWGCWSSIFWSNLLPVWSMWALKTGSNPEGNSTLCITALRWWELVRSLGSVHSITSSLRYHLYLEKQGALVWRKASYVPGSVKLDFDWGHHVLTNFPE